MGFHSRLSRLALIAGLAAMVVLLVGPSAAGQQNMLRFRWTKGEPVRYRMTQETTTSLNMPPMGDMSVGNTFAQVWVMTPQEIATDGTVTVATKIESAKMDLTSQFMSISYDSTKPPQPGDPAAEIGNVVSAMIGPILTMTIAPDGTVISVSGMAAIRDKALAAMPGVGAVLGGMGGIQDMLSDDAIKGAYAQLFAVLPPKQVKAGETWTNEIKQPNAMGDLTIARTITHKGVEKVDGRDLTKLGLTFTVKAGQGRSIGPVTMQASEGAGEGEILFDHSAGRLYRQTSRHSQPITMAIAAPTGETMNAAGTVQITQTLQLIEK